jgi:sugar lactone lactonase YvrE
MNTWTFERVAGPYQGALCGVAWDGKDVLFCAEAEGRILRLVTASAKVEDFRRYTPRVSGIAFGPGGELYGCAEGSRRVVEYLPDGSTVITATRIDGKLHNFPRDLVVDSTGRIWFADPHSAVLALGPQIYPALDYASVLIAARARNNTWFLRRVTYDSVAPRAVLLSSDEKTLFVAEAGKPDGHRSELRAYPVQGDAEVGQHTVLHTFSADHRGVQRGIEGMCLDADGNIIACAGSRKHGPGPRIYVFSPQGAVLESHEFPDDLPVRCAFAGPDLSDLYVTTATGSLYRAGNLARRGRARTQVAKVQAQK